MWTISEVKETGKNAFKANYWPCVLVALLMTVFTGSGAASSRWNNSGSGVDTTGITSGTSGLNSEELFPVLMVVLGVGFAIAAGALIVKLFLVNPIHLGGAAFFKTNVEYGPAPFSTIGTGFRNYWHNFVVLFLRDLYLFFWLLLFLIPGFIKAYSYCMVPYILAENPDMPANEVITRSREMMDGNKWQAFLLDLSFLGWILLGIMTLGLGLIFWTSPYMNSTRAALYLKLKNQTFAV